MQTLSVAEKLSFGAGSANCLESESVRVGGQDKLRSIERRDDAERLDFPELSSAPFPFVSGKKTIVNSVQLRRHAA